MKILYITTIGGTMSFFTSLIKELIDGGHTVDIATNETNSKVPDCYREWDCKVFPISTSRSPFSSGNVKAIKEIRTIAKDYDIVHCHTPLAGMATRLACKPLRKNGVKVIYTAHGFHFYKGAPLKNWLLYYPIEWVCAHWTDVLITINKEDFECAKKHMHAKKVEYIPGVGIDTERFANTKVDRKHKRVEIGVPENAFLVLSVGELNENKNHKVVIEAISKLDNKNIHYAIAGKGELKNYLEDVARECGVESNVHLLGYRTDVAELYKTADLYALPSIREGLNVSLMEAMASGRFIICSNIRGNRDMVDTQGGCLCSPLNVSDFIKSISHITHNVEETIKEGAYNKLKAAEYDVNAINKKITAIYFGE